MDRAAINHHAAEGYHRGPAKGEPRDKWLTRSDAAKLIWTCWRYRERQKISRRPLKGQKVATGKRPLRHLARFILVGIYSGSRAGAIAAASPIAAIGRAFVDLDRGIYYRRKQGSAKTNKRQPPASIPPRLLAHLRRWQRLGLAGSHFVEFNGKPVKSVKTGFTKAVALAQLNGEGSKVVPHTLRHTAATWLMQRGVAAWEAAGYLGMSTEMIERVYGHHSPEHLRKAAEAITGKTESVSVVVSVVVSVIGEKNARPKLR